MESKLNRGQSLNVSRLYFEVAYKSSLVRAMNAKYNKFVVRFSGEENVKIYNNLHTKMSHKISVPGEMPPDCTLSQ